MLALLLYYRIYIVYRDFITTLTIGVLTFTVIQNLVELSLFRYRIVLLPL